MDTKTCLSCVHCVEHLPNQTTPNRVIFCKQWVQTEISNHNCIKYDVSTAEKVENEAERVKRLARENTFSLMKKISADKKSQYKTRKVFEKHSQQTKLF